MMEMAVVMASSMRATACVDRSGKRQRQRTHEQEPDDLFHGCPVAFTRYPKSGTPAADGSMMMMTAMARAQASTKRLMSFISAASAQLPAVAAAFRRAAAAHLALPAAVVAGAGAAEVYADCEPRLTGI